MESNCHVSIMVWPRSCYQGSIETLSPLKLSCLCCNRGSENLTSGDFAPFDDTSPDKTASPERSSDEVCICCPVKKIGKLPARAFEDTDLVELHLFSTENHIPELGNSALSCLAIQNEKAGRSSSAFLIELVMEEGAMFDFVVEEAAHRLTPDTLTTSISLLPGDYVEAVMQAVLRDRTLPEEQRTSRKWSKRRVCKYFHKHAGEQDQSMCMKQHPCKFDLKHGLKLRQGSPSVMDCRIEANETSRGWLGETATVLVGPNKVPFFVHVELTWALSDYFRGALKGGFAEGESKAVELLADSEESFAIFMHWSYTQRVHMPTQEEYRRLNARREHQG